VRKVVKEEITNGYVISHPNIYKRDVLERAARSTRTIEKKSFPTKV
jgi:hypothetical protein